MSGSKDKRLAAILFKGVAILSDENERNRSQVNFLIYCVISRNEQGILPVATLM